MHIIANKGCLQESIGLISFQRKRKKFETTMNKRNNASLENQLNSPDRWLKRKSLKNILWLCAFCVCCAFSCNI